MVKRSFPLFLARRFYNNAGEDKKRKASKLAINIATTGVALGLAVMIISICVVKGFQNEISRKMSGFTSDIMILNDSSFFSPDSYPIVTDSMIISLVRAIKGVEKVQRVSQKMGILKTNDNYQTVILKGIAEDYDDSFLRESVVDGNLPHFSDSIASNEIMISQMQADALGLHIGSKVYSYFFEETIKMRKLEVVAVYQTNLPQFDEHYVITDRSLVNRLNKWKPDQSSFLEVHIDNFDKVDDVHMRIGRELNGTCDCYGSTYNSISIKENPQTAPAISWLEVLNMNVLVILALMMGVAGFTMISGLLILILERTRTIGVLKALGASNSRIRHTFIFYASLIIVRGLVWGNIVGLGIVLGQKYFGIVHLDPSSYYVSTAPVLVNWGWIISLNIVTLVITVLALVIPSFVVSRIQPAKAIQFD